MCDFDFDFSYIKQEQSVLIIVGTVGINLNYCLSEIKFLVFLGLWKWH